MQTNCQRASLNERGGAVMGEMADDMVNGASCSLCGIYFQEEHGYPVICKSCYNHLSKEDLIKTGLPKAIHKEM